MTWLRRVALIVAVAATAAVLGLRASDFYPFNGPTAGASEHAPAGVGQPIPVVVLAIAVRPGDRIEFVSAEPVGLPADVAVEWFYSPPVLGADGTRTIGVDLRPLAGASASAPASASPGPDNAVGIVARLTASKPGRFVLSAFRLTYRINGGWTQTRQGIDIVVTICADDPAPADCPLEPT